MSVYMSPEMLAANPGVGAQPLTPQMQAAFAAAKARAAAATAPGSTWGPSAEALGRQALQQQGLTGKAFTNAAKQAGYMGGPASQRRQSMPKTFDAPAPPRRFGIVGGSVAI